MNDKKDGLNAEPSRVRVRACAFCPWDRYPGERRHTCPGCTDDDQDRAPSHLALRYEIHLYAAILGICLALACVAVLWKNLA